MLTKYGADYFATGCKNFGGQDPNSKGTLPISEIPTEKERRGGFVRTLPLFRIV